MPRKDVGESLSAEGPVEPERIPLPKVDLNELEALNKPCGSEDQIIPDSDEEEEEGEEGEAKLPTKKLDLARFAYS